MYTNLDVYYICAHFSISDLYLFVIFFFFDYLINVIKRGIEITRLILNVTLLSLYTVKVFGDFVPETPEN